MMDLITQFVLAALIEAANNCMPYSSYSYVRVMTACGQTAAAAAALETIEAMSQ